MRAHVISAELVTALRQAKGRTLPQLLRDNAREFPSHTALKAKHAGIWHTRNWGEVFSEVCTFARGLSACATR